MSPASIQFAVELFFQVSMVIRHRFKEKIYVEAASNQNLVPKSSGASISNPSDASLLHFPFRDSTMPLRKEISKKSD